MQRSGYLFVYGSLRKQSNGDLHPFLQEQSDFIGYATLPGRLYMVENYPGAVICEAGDKELVNGEVYRLHNPERVLSVLDKYEECTPDFPQPHEYRRQLLTISLTDKVQVLCWVYLYNLPVSELQQLKNGDFRP